MDRKEFLSLLGLSVGGAVVVSCLHSCAKDSGVTRGSKEFTDAVSKSKFSKTSPAFGTVDKGHIMLQEHGGVAFFKNIKIKII